MPSLARRGTRPWHLSKGGGPRVRCQHTSLPEAHEAPIAHYDMVEYLDTQDASGLRQPCRDAQIISARLGAWLLSR